MEVAVTMSPDEGVLPSAFCARMMTDTPPWMSRPVVMRSPRGVKPRTHTPSTTTSTTSVETYLRTCGLMRLGPEP